LQLSVGLDRCCRPSKRGGKALDRCGTR
jgi:hypothetical protein